MRHLPKILILLFLFQNLSAQTNRRPLFDDPDLSEFRQLGGDAEFTYADGILTGTTKHDTPNSFLATKEIFGDFILEFSVKIEYGMNSGVQFRSNLHPQKEYVFGYQCEIETSERKWAGGIYDEARRGWLYPLTRNAAGQNAFKNGTWNHYRIEAIGSQIRTWVNGVSCANLVDEMTAAGFIAFQVHSIGKNDRAGQKVRWKDVFITTDLTRIQRQETTAPEVSLLVNKLSENERRKGWRLLWDGKTADGWRGAKSDDFPDRGWSMKDGILAVEKSDGAESANGGDIITHRQFSDFELCVDFKISEGANSGIKYFVQPEINKGAGSAIGLEFQILDNQKHPDAEKGTDGNRTLGALYDLIPPQNLSEVGRRRDIRHKNGQWNQARIVVQSGRVEHWLNEIKIIEYDRFSQTFAALVGHSKYREIENFGRFTAGHILLQDHGDAVEFRSIKIREF